MDKCELCKQNKKLVKHHVSYLEGKTINVCLDCHSKIHHTDLFKELKPPEGHGNLFRNRNNSILTEKEMDLKKKFTETNEKLKPIIVYLDEDLQTKFKVKCYKEETNISDKIRFLIKIYLESDLK
jgi:ribosome-binding protein aMBF1 (putative translation factor)